MTEPPTATALGDDVLEVLGLAAYTDLRWFCLVAGQAADAPSLALRQRMAELASEVLDRQRRTLAVAARHGAGAEVAMGPFDGLLDDFEARTAPMTWWEGVVKAYVGHAVAADVCRTAVHGLPPEARAEALDILDGPAVDDGLVHLLSGGVSGDPVLAARLALWGRRVVGEALGVVQRLLATRPRFADMAAAARAGLSEDGASVPGRAGGPRSDGDDVQAWIFARLTAEHTRRMDRLGMAA